MVFCEIAQELTSRGFAGPQQAWNLFTSLAGVRGEVDTEGFTAALKQLGFGAGSRFATLTSVEVRLLISSCDINGDGFIDSNEWCDRFSRALSRLQGEELVCDQPTAASDLQVIESCLTPACLASGRWPSGDEWSLSDHGVLLSKFRLAHARPIVTGTTTGTCTTCNATAAVATTDNIVTVSTLDNDDGDTKSCR